MAEGPQGVREAVLAAGGDHGSVIELSLTPEATQRHADIVIAAHAAGLTPVTVTPEVLSTMVDTVSPQGLLAICRRLDVPLAQVLALRPRLVAVLARVRDPGNAGTVIRAADAAGADAVVLTDASVELYNPKCVRATAGSLFHLPIVTGVELAEAVAGLKAAGLTVLAADGDGPLDLDELQDEAHTAPGSALLTRSVAWVFGNEAWGLPETDRDLADAVVRVPVHGRAESLNLATAATVCLYATARAQRRDQAGAESAIQ